MATTTTATPRNWTHLTGKLIGNLFLIGALVVSYTHIVHLFQMLGLHGWQSYAAPAFIDGFALLGRLGRSEQFAAATRRTGLKIQVIATAISLIANVVAGDSWGGRIFGALVVAGYVIAEVYVDQLRPVADDAQAAQQAEADALAAKRSAAATKAAATRAANKAKAKPGTPKQRANAKAARTTRQLAKQIDAPLATDTRAYL
jgi:hypothetical protein